MRRKLEFHERYGVQEYYLYDPYKDALKGHRRRGDELAAIDELNGWTSPLLKIRFDLSTAPMTIRYPDGRPFLTFQDLGERLDASERERERMARELATSLRERDRLAAKLRELGIDVD